jgi:hypothetical protein
VVVTGRGQGFILTLTEGKVTARIDKPLYDDEEFTIKAGGLALSVRGTIFTVALENLGIIATVSVERGEVAVIDENDEARIAYASATFEPQRYAGETWAWWLRSPGFLEYCAAFVYGNGNIAMNGNEVYSDIVGGIRPALWLNLE